MNLAHWSSPATPGDLFSIGDSGQVWESTAASWSDDYAIAASSLQEFNSAADREPALSSGCGTVHGDNLSLPQLGNREQV
ncbi:hypothetical protein [Streptomyces qinglanensis]|uniref:hypothetical protein n=1 Tax=Streptomyces qinglanensis TaxID=943816 RepID=UPI000943CAD1|nr:hypothetical protein [Streptomyces qinglanensis]